jgi:hypothetical protein
VTTTMTQPTQVKWIGAHNPLNNHPPEFFKTHALDCWYMDALERRYGSPAPIVAASSIPANIGRCGHCGGGR